MAPNKKYYLSIKRWRFQCKSFFFTGFNESSVEENPRDFMLKKDDHPGYLKPDHSKERHDVEIDGLPDDFGKFHNKPAEQPNFSRPNHEGFTRSFNFGQSFSSSSVRLSGQYNFDF